MSHGRTPLNDYKRSLAVFKTLLSDESAASVLKFQEQPDDSGETVTAKTALLEAALLAQFAPAEQRAGFGRRAYHVQEVKMAKGPVFRIKFSFHDKPQKNNLLVGGPNFVTEEAAAWAADRTALEFGWAFGCADLNYPLLAPLHLGVERHDKTEFYFRETHYRQLLAAKAAPLRAPVQSSGGGGGGARGRGGGRLQDSSVERTGSSRRSRSRSRSPTAFRGRGGLGGRGGERGGGGGSGGGGEGGDEGGGS